MNSRDVPQPTKHSEFIAAHRSARCSVLLLAILVVVMVGCTKDASVRKAKYLESGQRYADKGKYREAIIQFGNAIQVDPEFAVAHYKLAQAYLKLQQWAPAYRELNRTVDLQPDNYTARLDLANLLIAGNELKEAKEQEDLLLEKQPENPTVHLAAANLLTAQQDLPQASEEMKRAISLAPDQSAPYLSLAILQTRMGQPQIAEVNFKKAAQLDPKATNTLLALGSLYQSQGRFAEAEQSINQAIAVNPNEPESRADMIRLYMSEGKRAEAEQLARQVSRDFPHNSTGYRMLGDFYYATGNVDGALAEYTMLYRDHRDDIQVQKNYLQLLILKDRLPEATKLDDEILKSTPNDIEALIDRGQIRFREGKFQESVDALQTAVKNDPTSGIAYYQLGNTLAGMGNFAQAEASWRSATRLRPDLSEAFIALAREALRRGDLPEAVHFASEVIRQKPESADGYALRALAYTKQAKFPDAEYDAAKAIDLAPQSASGYLQLANLNLVRKHFSDAATFYSRALDRDPGSADALAGLMQTYLTQNQRDKAFSAAQSQIVKNPNNSVFYDLLGTAQFEYRKAPADISAAESNLKKSAELKNTNTDAWMKLSRLQVARGAPKDALSTMQQAIQDNPNQSALYVLDGQLLEGTGSLDQAKEAYQRALQLDATQPLASGNLASLLTRTSGNLDVALSLAQTARRGMPGSPGAADTLGWVLYEKGAYRSALDSFQEALRLADKSKTSENPTLQFHLGLAYEKAGQKALAREHLQRVLKIDPNYSSAEDIKKMLGQLHG
jgi:cellulose synthase operon protein C